VILLINGYKKAKALQATVEGAVTQAFTCSALQLHPKAIIVCDEDATVELKVGTYKYFKEIEKDEMLA
jgi:glucosamine-6-phosphate deaminase